jgi:hypothetical protein
MKFSNFRFFKNSFSGSAFRPAGVKTDGRTVEPMAVLIDLCRNPKAPKGYAVGHLNPQRY